MKTKKTQQADSIGYKIENIQWDLKELKRTNVEYEIVVGVFGLCSGEAYSVMDKLIKEKVIPPLVDHLKQKLVCLKKELEEL